ncbi:MAG: hypothetical protein GTN49_11915 [candidate division Zixibacteria bacterium]|nr:hypothetical protein [candidate division Zixibacteria bacterium]
MKILSIILAYIALTAGTTAAVAMLLRMGRAGDKPRPAGLWVHRVAGYLFIVIMTCLFAWMLYRVTMYGKGLTPGVAWHGAAGFAVMVFIFFKWAVVRPFRGLMKLAPALGIVVLSHAFVVINLGATMDLLDWLGAGELAGGAVIEVVPRDEAQERDEEGTDLVRPAEGEGGRLPATRFVFAGKCGNCHHLRRSFDGRYVEGDWPPVIERMRSYDPDWISDDDVVTIEFYLTGDYGPGT